MVGERRHGRTQASLKMAVTIGKLLKIGTSGPIDAGGNGPQRATRASDTGFGREDAICEYIEIMQISPVRATMAAYKCIRGILQYAGAEVLQEDLGLRFIT